MSDISHWAQFDDDELKTALSVIGPVCRPFRTRDLEGIQDEAVRLRISFDRGRRELVERIEEELQSREEQR